MEDMLCQQALFHQPHGTLPDFLFPKLWKRVLNSQRSKLSLNPRRVYPWRYIGPEARSTLVPGHPARQAFLLLGEALLVDLTWRVRGLSKYVNDTLMISISHIISLVLRTIDLLTTSLSPPDPPSR